MIVDEIHSVAGTKRGAHLALSLERLDHVTDGPLQRIGLSATQRPLDEIGRFLGGVDRPVTLVDVGKRKRLDLEVVVPHRGHGQSGRLGAASPRPAARCWARACAPKRAPRSGRRSTRGCSS